MTFSPARRAGTACLLAVVAISVSVPSGQPRGAVEPGVDTSVSFKLIANRSDLALGVQSGSHTTGAKAIAKKDGNGEDLLWRLLPAENKLYKVVNIHTGALLGIADSSPKVGALVVQRADTGSAGNVWEIAEAGGGYYKIANSATGLTLGLAGRSARAGASAILAAGQLWKLIPSGAAYPAPMALTGDLTVHDPSMIRTADGTWYLFGTHGGIRISSSVDRVHFTTAGQALSPIPSWVSAYNRGDLWAPDVSGRGGRYWLYYAASRFGVNTSAIGLATSQTGAPGSWSDQGIVYSSQASDNYNAIDPGLLEDAAGKWWLSFGSFWGGIMLIEVDPANGKQASWNQTRYPLARRPESPAIEGACIYLHDKRYYLFASFDRCCRGVNSTYHIVVGRSTRVTGPYYDPSGIAMSQGGGAIVLSSHGNVVGPGGQVVFRDGDEELLVYHYYDGANKGRPTLGMNRIRWDSSGWPRMQ
ncbi:MAG: family 43 glycosylhydrolase [Bryobacteraceae bacterium]